MAGENPDSSDPLFDGHLDPDYEARSFVELGELEQLLEALDEKGTSGYLGTEGRSDWALERESEIARLEKENEELRRLLGIDEGSVAAKGVSVDLDRVDSGRFSTFLSSARRRGPSQNEGYHPRPYWEAQSQQQDQYQQQQASGAPLQRAMDLQPGMRMGSQARGRRAGMFGGGRGGNRGGLSGIGAGPNPNTLWNNQPASPGSLVDRPWQG